MLQDLLEEQAQLERRIALLEAQLAAAEIVSPARDGRAGIGSVVRVRDGHGATVEYELVGPLEADIDTGRVSIGAPVGQALLGRRAGARVDVTAPGGRHTLEVVAVRRVAGHRGGGVRPLAGGEARVRRPRRHTSSRDRSTWPPAPSRSGACR